jgi:hypothetical protein
MPLTAWNVPARKSRRGVKRTCAAAGFLGWIIVRSIQAAPWSQRWSLAGIIAVGVILMIIAWFALRSPFFQTPRESA